MKKSSPGLTPVDDYFRAEAERISPHARHRRSAGEIRSEAAVRSGLTSPYRWQLAREIVKVRQDRNREPLTRKHQTFAGPSNPILALINVLFPNCLQYQVASSRARWDVRANRCSACGARLPDPSVQNQPYRKPFDCRGCGAKLRRWNPFGPKGRYADGIGLALLFAVVITDLGARIALPLLGLGFVLIVVARRAERIIRAEPEAAR